MTDLWPLLRPLVRALPPEAAHRLTVRALATGLRPGTPAGLPVPPDPPVLATRMFGLDFANPIGLAAGFDKNAEVPGAMLRLGFGSVEVGTITPRPQRGNPKPRVFRVPERRAVINRLGFNNRGLVEAAERLRRLDRDADRPPGPIGANIGRNKDSADAIADYRMAVLALAGVADWLTVNVSSPNTPGLRALQSREALTGVIGAVQEAREEAGAATPILLKIAPDLTPQDREDIAGVALETGLDGLIVANTTIERPADLPARYRELPGGLSGRPLFEPSTRLLAEMARLTGRRVPLIGVGGVASGADAYAKIRAGAGLVQLYTALVYEGPGLVRRIKADLADLLTRDGYAHVADAVGADL